MAQTFTDFEVIMVDDESKDNSGELCEEVAREYSGKIRVFHQSNTGAGGARNKAIQYAKGEYLAFFDIDDEIMPNWLAECHDYIIKYRPQILMFGRKEITPDGKIETKKFDFNFYESNDDFKKDYLRKFSGLNFNNGFLWNKIYERKFWDSTGKKIPDLRIQQDEVFNLSIYPLVERVLSIPEIYYIYYIYDKGNTRSHYIPERLEIYKTVRDSFLDLEENWTGKNHEFEKYIYKRFYNCIFDVIGFNLFHPENNISKKEQLKIIKDIYQDEDIIHSLRRAKELGVNPSGIFGKAYFKAICNKSVFQFLAIRRIHKVIAFFVKN